MFRSSVFNSVLAFCMSYCRWARERTGEHCSGQLPSKKSYSSGPCETARGLVEEVVRGAVEGLSLDSVLRQR